MRWTNRIIKYIGFTLIPVGIALFCKQVFISHQGFNDAIVGVVAALIGMIPEGLILLTSVVFCRKHYTAVSTQNIGTRTILY